MRHTSSQSTNMAMVNSQGDSLSSVELMACVPPRSWPQLVYDVGEMRLEANVEVARTRQIDRLGHDDVPGPRAHAGEFVGQGRRFPQALRYPDHGEAGL